MATASHTTTAAHQQTNAPAAAAAAAAAASVASGHGRTVSRPATLSRHHTQQNSFSSTRLLDRPLTKSKQTRVMYPKVVKEEFSKLMESGSLEAIDQMGGVDGICRLFRVNPKLGHYAPSSHADTIRIAFGPNTIPRPPEQDFIMLVAEALGDTMLMLLCAAALLSLILGLIPATSEDPSHGWIEGVAIFAAVGVVVMVGSVNNYQKEVQFRKLTAKKDSRGIKVYRNGGQLEVVDVSELLVGDIVDIGTGDKIPADGILIEGKNLTCDESAVTGETDPRKKGYPSPNTPNAEPFMRSATVVLSGTGKMVVVAVGVMSFDGRLRMELREKDKKETPLQEKLGDLADNIGKVGLGFAVFTFFSLTIKLLIVTGLSKDGFTGALTSEIIKILILCITVVVVAVPEGLPLAVTISLAYSMIKMVQDNNLVRDMDACETMGGVTTICSDKTGTLTQNKMTAVKGLVAGVDFDFVDRAANNIETVASQAQRFAVSMPSDLLGLFTTSIAVNTQCAWIKNPKTHELEFQGSKTEQALTELCEQCGVAYEKRRRDFEDTLLIEFSSARKMMSTLVATKPPAGAAAADEDAKHSSPPATSRDPRMFYCHTKGAPEIVIERCRDMITSTGAIVPLDSAARANIFKHIAAMTGAAMRTIGLAYRPIKHADFEATKADIDTGKCLPGDDGVAPVVPVETELIWIGVVGIQDPLRPEVPDAVRRCQAAGVRVIMVTGDNIDTARNIAKNCGIYHPPYGVVLEGKDFRVMTPEQLKPIIPRLAVLARSSPNDKKMLVKAIQETREIVAVTGDGTNDGPALRQSDIGFSMGIAGTEVAKEASKVILMDDNFASLVKAIMWGRSVYDSVRAFLQFQLTVNMVAMLMTYIGAISDSKSESPLTAVQLLWVNLIMDTFAALALATQPPTERLLMYAPYGKDDELITTRMKRFIVCQALFQLGVNLLMLYEGYDMVPVKGGYMSGTHKTMIFNVFVCCQLFNEINARKVHGEINVFEGTHKNKYFIFVMVFSVVLQFLMVQFLGGFADTRPLNGEQWGLCIGFAAIGLPLGLVINLFNSRLPEKYAENRLDVMKREAEEETARQNAAANGGGATGGETKHGYVAVDVHETKN